MIFQGLPSSCPQKLCCFFLLFRISLTLLSKCRRVLMCFFSPWCIHKSREIWQLRISPVERRPDSRSLPFILSTWEFWTKYLCPHGAKITITVPQMPKKNFLCIAILSFHFLLLLSSFCCNSRLKILFVKSLNILGFGCFESSSPFQEHLEIHICTQESWLASQWNNSWAICLSERKRRQLCLVRFQIDGALLKTWAWASCLLL